MISTTRYGPTNRGLSLPEVVRGRDAA